MRSLLLSISLIIASLSLSIAQPDNVFEKAESLYQEGDYEGSLRMLEQFVDQYPDRKYDLASAYFLMSANFMKLKEMDGAVWANQQSLELRNKLRTDQVVENVLRFGEIYLSSHRYDDALNHLLQAAEMPFENPEIFADINFHLAEVYQALGDLDLADDYYYRTSQILSVEFGETYEKLIPIYLQQARLALGSQDFSSAFSYYAQALALEENIIVTKEYYEEPLLQILSELGIGKYNGETSSKLMFMMAKQLMTGR